MSAALLDANDVVTSWLTGIDLEDLANPAGPVFASGEFAEGDIVASNLPGSLCSLCTGSANRVCC